MPQDLPKMTREEQAAYDEALRRIEKCRQAEAMGTDLVLSSIGLRVLPPEIGQLRALTLLDLSDNQLTTLPPEIGLLSSLIRLVASNNQLMLLPPEIGQMGALQDLQISDNLLKGLPPEIGRLTSLLKLAANDNRLVSLPSEIGQLTSLKRLAISSNHLTSLPPEIGQLSSLTELIAASNDLTSLPSEIGQLSALTELRLNENKLHSLPGAIGHLQALKRLELYKNFITSLPPEIGQIQTLQELFVAHNQLTVLPPEIGQLRALTRLEAYSNHLSSLPPEIGRMSSMRDLFVAYNQLAALPAEIGDMASLTRLEAHGNQLTMLPPEIGNASALKELFVSYNKLSCLPPEIGKLASLTELDIAENRIETLPDELGRLQALTVLDASKNQLTHLPFCIFELVSLTQLFVSGNQLTFLPPEIGQLSSLTQFTISNNKLTSLPPEIGGLSHLQLLGASNNKLNFLSPEFSQLNELRQLFLHDNLGLGLPTEVMGPRMEAVYGNDRLTPASPKAILDYYYSRRFGERPLQEVKVLLVGRGEAGKSSVTLQIRQGQFDKHQRETPGIDIQSTTISCDGGPVKLHLWDFAGQEITHETHRFFLSQRSLYLVVLDGRGGQQMEEAEYWLSHVQRYGSTPSGDSVEHSPVIVVLNKWKSPGPYDVERRRLQREHPNIRAFVETDCATGHGIDTLKAAIAAAIDQMPGVWQTWPMAYFRVREQLVQLSSSAERARRKHFLPWPEYRRLCEGCGIKDSQRQASLAENLNALGIALYYGADARLRDTRVLNPNWAANGLYGLVRGVQRRPYGGHPGHLWAGEVAAVLAEGLEGMNKERGATIEDYPAEKDGVKVHEFLLDLMVDRELGFQAGDHEKQPLYLLPGLLSLDEPEPAEFDVAAHIDGSQVRFRYLYELLPAGVMSRFIVRTHALSEETFRWQRGVVLAWGNARALVMAERRRSPRVDVFIRGGTAEERQQLAGVVRSNMEEIHRGLPEGLRGKEQLDLNVPGEQYQDVSKLEQLEQARQPVQVVTPTGPQQVPVTPELEQVQPARARQDGAPRLKIFVSYAHKDYRLWDALKMHLDILKNEKLISVWWDGQIRPGSEWDDAIRDELNQADIVVLMLSNGFFASRYIRGVEMEAARQRRQNGEADILPVLLEPTPAFANHPWLKDLQTVPNSRGELRAVTSFTPRNTGWNHVQTALRRVIAEVAAWETRA